MKLINAPDICDWEGFRDRVYIELVYAAGLRAREAADITLADLDLDNGYVTVPAARAKSRKERKVKLPWNTLLLLRRYVRTLEADRREGRILGIGKDALRKRFTKYAEAANLGHHTPRDLRHAFATHLLMAGASIKAVQESMGHAHIKTTERYTHFIQDMSDAQLEKYHPLNQQAPEANVPLRIVEKVG